MKAILIQGQGSTMLKSFHVAPCCYPLRLGPVSRQKKCILSGIANSSKIIFAFPVKTTKIFGQHCLHCIQTGPNILKQTRPSRIGVEVGKDTVRRAHFGVFSTSHFTRTALSSDWKVHIFRHRHFFITHRGFSFCKWRKSSMLLHSLRERMHIRGRFSLSQVDEKYEVQLK